MMETAYSHKDFNSPGAGGDWLRQLSPILRIGTAVSTQTLCVRATYCTFDLGSTYSLIADLRDISQSGLRNPNSTGYSGAGHGDVLQKMGWRACDGMMSPDTGNTTTRLS